MKTRILVACAAALFLSGMYAFAASETEIKLEAKKMADGKTHWEPERIVVHPGDKLKITATYTAKGGFDFHGLLIPALKVTEKVDRDKPKTIEVTVPQDMKPGEYKIGCQFHEAHQPATLVVEAPKSR